MVLDDTPRKKLIASVEDGFAEQIAYTQDLGASGCNPLAATNSLFRTAFSMKFSVIADTRWSASIWTVRPSGGIPAAPRSQTIIHAP